MIIKACKPIAALCLIVLVFPISALYVHIDKIIHWITTLNEKLESNPDYTLQHYSYLITDMNQNLYSSFTLLVLIAIGIICILFIYFLPEILKKITRKTHL